MRIFFVLFFALISVDSNSNLLCNVKGKCEGRTLSRVEDVPDIGEQIKKFLIFRGCP